MGLLDLITGGKAGQATDLENQAMDAFKNLQTPTAAQLTLPQLEQYVQQGILTPEQAQAYLVQSNALEGTSANNQGLKSELGALSSLTDIVNSGGADAQEKADIQNVENTMGTAEHGADAAALADQARRGTANSGLTLAALLSGNQNAATNANSNAINAAAAAEQRNIAATEAAGTLGGNVQGQEYGADLNKANAANAIAQFNAGTQNTTEAANVAARNTAQNANLQNKQAISNANVQSKQTQQASASAAQQQAFEDALSKATGEANTATGAANNANTQGQQLAGTIGSLISAGGQVATGGMGAPAIGAASSVKAPPPGASSSVFPGQSLYAHGGEVCMEGGGRVPGEPPIPGVDTEKNDIVPAQLTPHEIVIPQTIAERRDPREIMSFIRSLPPVEKPSVHPRAVLDTLRALDMHHSGGR